MILSGLLHLPGSCRSQTFASGLQEATSLKISIKVYMITKMLMPWRKYLRVRPAAFPSSRRSKRLMEILERPLPTKMGILKAKFHLRISMPCCGVRWTACWPKP